jgi:hypothetical protein
MNREITIIEALENAIEMLHAQGNTGGDVIDDAMLAVRRLRERHPKVAVELV